MSSATIIRQISDINSKKSELIKTRDDLKGIVLVRKLEENYLGNLLYEIIPLKGDYYEKMVKQHMEIMESYEEGMKSKINAGITAINEKIEQCNGQISSLWIQHAVAVKSEKEEQERVERGKLL